MSRNGFSSCRHRRSVAQVITALPVGTGTDQPQRRAGSIPIEIFGCNTSRVTSRGGRRQVVWLIRDGGFQEDSSRLKRRWPERANTSPDFYSSSEETRIQENPPRPHENLMATLTRRAGSDNRTQLAPRAGNRSHYNSYNHHRCPVLCATPSAGYGRLNRGNPATKNCQISTP